MIVIIRVKDVDADYMDHLPDVEGKTAFGSTMDVRVSRKNDKMDIQIERDSSFFSGSQLNFIFSLMNGKHPATGREEKPHAHSHQD